MKFNGYIVGHNNIRKDDEILMTYGRRGKMMDNQKGIIRTVEVYEDLDNGFFNEIGSVYVSEIVGVKKGDKWYRVRPSEAHDKKLSKLEGMLNF